MNAQVRISYQASSSSIGELLPIKKQMFNNVGTKRGWTKHSHFWRARMRTEYSTHRIEIECS
jgi:hypothetical protein